MSSLRVNVLIGRSGLKYSGKRDRCKGGSRWRSSIVPLVAQEEAGISITGKLVSEFPAPVGSSPKLSPPSFSIPSLLHCVHPSSRNN